MTFNSPSSKPRVLCVVMDGIGLRESRFGNAVALARKPVLDRLMAQPLFTTLQAHGTAVGLPSDDDIGNSEVGHNALGAGRIFVQGATLVQIAINDRSMYRGDTWTALVSSVKSRVAATLHFIGLLSDGNVHAHEQHLYSMLREAKSAGVPRVRIHALLDGRDVGEKSAEIYVDRLERVMTELRSASFDVAVASGGGRMKVTMDRYNADWAMVERGWNAHVHGRAQLSFPSLPSALANFREDALLTDQYLPPFVIERIQGEPAGRILSGDGVVFFNFRGDRAIEISRAFTEGLGFDAFDRGHVPQTFFAGMMQYDGDLHIPPRYLVAPPAIDHPLTEYLLAHGVRQFACSETQKYGHVTYFWNGNKSGYFDPTREEYVEVPSDSGITFDERPEMKAKEIADVVIDRMQRGTFDFGRINFANGDMVGHTGFLDAAIRSIEFMDVQLGRIVKAAEETGTTLIVTADHGNADEMYDAKEKDFPEWEAARNVPGSKRPRPKTAHTVAPVPCCIVGPDAASFRLADLAPRSLGNVAATAIALLGLPPSPLYMPSLVMRKGSI